MALLVAHGVARSSPLGLNSLLGEARLEDSLHLHRREVVLEHGDLVLLAIHVARQVTERIGHVAGQRHRLGEGAVDGG